LIGFSIADADKIIVCVHNVYGGYSILSRSMGQVMQ
jgi:hypothetical protein